MDDVEGAKAFRVAGRAYDSFMGRYSGPLAQRFADAVGVTHGQTALDVGCGPGALTGVLVERLGADAVCGLRSVGTVRRRRASTDTPAWSCASRGRSDPVRRRCLRPRARAVGGALRVGSRSGSVRTLPGGTSGRVGRCVRLGSRRRHGDAAPVLGRRGSPSMRLPLVTAVPCGSVRPGELVELFDRAGLSQVTETTLRVTLDVRGLRRVVVRLTSRASDRPGRTVCRSPTICARR